MLQRNRQDNQKMPRAHTCGYIVLLLDPALLFIQGCAKKLVPGWDKSSAQLQPALAGHARLLLNKTVTFLSTTLYMSADACTNLSAEV